MNRTRLLRKALKYATEKHKNQLDDSGKSYIVHPIQVCEILSMVANDDTNLLAAAYLHDVIEDCGVTYFDLERNFNKDIADLVMEVTKIVINRVKYFPRLSTQRGIMLKFADRLSNISRMESWSEKRKKHYLKSSKFWK